MSNATELRGKRIVALDYGLRRIGIAVCDEMHITVSTRPFILNDAGVWESLDAMIVRERAEVIVVGVPRHHDGRTSDIIEAIERFIEELRQRVQIGVDEMDEAFSTQRAVALLQQSGGSKKRRTQKGRKDEVAAAIILQDYLEEHQLR